jgi:hypothetical protein
MTVLLIIVLIVLSIITCNTEGYGKMARENIRKAMQNMKKKLLVDKHPVCTKYGKRTEKLCKTNAWIKKNCAKTCKPHNQTNILADKNSKCSQWKQCCPGGTGSGNGIRCGTADCKGSTCKGAWMSKNCATTCATAIKSKGIVKIRQQKTKPKKSFLNWLKNKKKKKVSWGNNNKVVNKRGRRVTRRPIRRKLEKNVLNSKGKQNIVNKIRSMQSSIVKKTEEVRSAKLKKQKITGSATHYNLWCANGDECIVPRNKMFGSGGLYGTNCDPKNPNAGWVLQNGKWTCNKKPDHGKHIGEYIMENDMLRIKNSRLSRNNNILQYKLNPKKKKTKIKSFNWPFKRFNKKKN